MLIGKATATDGYPGAENGPRHEPKISPISGTNENFLCYRFFMPNTNPSFKELGEIDELFQLNQLAEALEKTDSLLNRFQTSDTLYLTKGICLIRMHQYEAAKSCLTTAANINPKKSEILFQLGVCHMQTGALREAITQFQGAVKLGLDTFGAHFMQAVCFDQLGMCKEALGSVKQAIIKDPDNPDAFNQLGTIYLSLREWASARPCFEQALKLKQTTVSLSNLAITQMMLGEPGAAIESIRKSLQIDPADANAYNTLGNIYIETGEISRALTAFNSAVQCKTDFADAHNHRGGALLRLRRTKEAIEAYERAISINPENAEAHNNRNLALNYERPFTDDEIFRKHQEYGAVFNRPGGFPKPQPVAQKKLRVGYVSADFRRHSVNYFFEPVLRNHDLEKFEVFCYYNNHSEDEVTANLKQIANHWRPIKHLNDRQVAQLIDDDGIDILVDLSGHTNGSRLPVFGLKPSPIQCSWLGYPNTTGLTTVDYRITDEYADPPNSSLSYYTETLLRLPGGFSCYQGDESLPVPRKKNRANQKANVTFGCFNNLIKVTDEVIDVWARLLTVTGSSRLMLKSGLGGSNDLHEPIVSRFSQAGIDPDRVIIRDRIDNWGDHVRLYGEIDIALDPFPYNGTTTTCEALWMGIPVVVLAGTSHAGRVGFSLMNQIGLPELIAHNIDHYIEIARGLAEDQDRLIRVSDGLRRQMLGSPLCDHTGFTRKLETAYQTMWQKFCSESGRAG